MKKLIYILIGLVIGLLIAMPVKAKSPYEKTQTQEVLPDILTTPTSTPAEIPKRPAQPSGRHNKLTPQEYVAAGGRTYTKDEVIQLIHGYSDYYHVPVEWPLAIAKCESGYRWDAKNTTSTASGVSQYLDGTWAGTDEAKAGLSVWDADANVKAMIKYLATRGHAKPWLASYHCHHVE